MRTLCGTILIAALAVVGEAGDLTVPSVVQSCPGYNSWPMVQAVGARLVCAYSRGSAHTVNEGRRGVFARVSEDFGATWSDEVCVCNTSEWGEVPVGKGLEDGRAMLLWVRRVDKRGWGDGTFHDLLRTTDGVSWEKIASPELDPHPIQITDIFSISGKRLMSLWFAGSYGKGTGHAWGTLTSTDGGRTWTQKTVEAGLEKAEWPTEPSAVHLGGGRILGMARCESGGNSQFQLTSMDGGETWKRERTNIRDVKESTPSLIYDAKTKTVFNYYYQRGARKLKCRRASADYVFGRPTEWPEPTILFDGKEERAHDAGNVNATVLGGRHFLSLYTGTKTDTTVLVVGTASGGDCGGDGAAWETAAIQAQIDAAAANGGGRVTVEKGVHPCGTLRLKSGVELHLEEGAVLKGGSASDDYDDAIPLEMVYRYGSTNAAPTVTRKAFIVAEDASDIAITGKGTIEIDGPSFFDKNTRLWKFFWAKPPCPRPRMVVMYRCRGVRIEGVTFKDCPLWTMWLRLCEDVAVSHIRIEAEQKMINSDGIDFDGCRHVRVGDSFFKTGDDCVVLRAIRDERWKDVPVVTEDVIVSNCVFDTFCQGVRIGCPSDDTVRNAVFRNIEFSGRNAIGSEQPLHYLTTGDKGYLKTGNILFENWKITRCDRPLDLYVDDGIVLRDFGHMTFRNFTVDSDKPFCVRGNASSPVKGMRFENIKGTVKGGKAFDIAHAPDIVLEDVDVAVDVADGK